MAALHELRDLLDALEHDPDDQGAIDQAISIVDRLIVDHERPLPTAGVGLCYRVPTPYSPASAPPQKAQPQPQPKKSRRPKSQQFEIRRKSA